MIDSYADLASTLVLDFGVRNQRGNFVVNPKIPDYLE